MHAAVPTPNPTQVNFSKCKCLEKCTSKSTFSAPCLSFSLGVYRDCAVFKANLMQVFEEPQVFTSSSERGAVRLHDTGQTGETYKYKGTF